MSKLADQVRSHESTFPDFGFPTHITDEAAHTEAKEALARAKHARDRNEILLGHAFGADAKESDAIGKLARYERSLERSLFRTLDELRQLQDRRRNRPSSPVLDAVALATGGYRMTTDQHIPASQNLRFLRNKAILAQRLAGFSRRFIRQQCAINTLRNVFGVPGFGRAHNTSPPPGSAMRRLRQMGQAWHRASTSEITETAPAVVAG